MGLVLELTQRKQVFINCVKALPIREWKRVFFKGWMPKIQIPFNRSHRCRDMEATSMRSPKPKVRMYRSGTASSVAVAVAAAARDRVSFGIIIPSSFLSFQPPPPPPIGLQLHKQKKKKKKKVVSQRVTSFEWVMIRRNLNLSLRRFVGADNKGIPELLLLRPDPKQQQQHHHHRVCCVGEESSSRMGDELNKQEKDGSTEEGKKIKEEVEEKSAPVPPEAPSPPEKPLPGDCCGNGCIPCVWDTYNEELEDYNNLLKAYNSQFKP